MDNECGPLTPPPPPWLQNQASADEAGAEHDGKHVSRTDALPDGPGPLSSSVPGGLTDRFTPKVDEFAPNPIGLDFRSYHSDETEPCETEVGQAQRGTEHDGMHAARSDATSMLVFLALPGQGNAVTSLGWCQATATINTKQPYTKPSTLNFNSQLSTLNQTNSRSWCTVQNRSDV